MEGRRLLPTEHHGKCLTCESFVILGFCLSVSLSLCLSVCVSLFLSVVCRCGARGCGCGGGGGRERREEERRRGETNGTMWAKVSLKIVETEALSGKTNDWRKRGHVVLNLFSNLKMERSKSLFLW